MYGDDQKEKFIVVDCCIEKCKVIIIGNDFEIEITKMA